MCYSEDGCAICTINVYFYTVNVLYMLCGATFVIIGVLMVTIPYFHREVLSNDLVIPPQIFIAVGVLMLIVSFIGFCGNQIDNYCLLVTYVFLASFFLLFTIATTIALVIYPVHITDYIKDKMKQEQETYSTEEDSKNYWDKFHNMFQCCGIYNSSEWLAVQGSIPYSCCQALPEKDAEDENAYCMSHNKRKPFLRDIGCLQKLESAYKRYSTIIMICSITACCVQLLCILCVCYLAKRAKGALRGHAGGERSGGCCCGGRKRPVGLYNKRNDRSTSTNAVGAPMNMNYGVLNSAFRIEYVPFDSPQKEISFLT